MANERNGGQESSFDFMELKHLAVEIEKGMSLSNLAQSLNQNNNTPQTGQSNETTSGGDKKKE